MPSDPANSPPVASPPDASKAHTPARVVYRQARRKFIVWLRNLFKLDEDLIRDQLLEKSLTDINALAAAFAEMLKQDALHVRLTQRMSARLNYYEQNVPRLRDLRKKYEREQQQKADEFRAKTGMPDENGIRAHPA